MQYSYLKVQFLCLFIMLILIISFDGRLVYIELDQSIIFYDSKRHLILRILIAIYLVTLSIIYYIVVHFNVRIVKKNAYIYSKNIILMFVFTVPNRSMAGTGSWQLLAAAAEDCLWFSTLDEPLDEEDDDDGCFFGFLFLVWIPSFLIVSGLLTPWSL